MKVHKLLDIKQIRKEYRIPRAIYVDYKVAYDGKIYLLMMTEKDFSIKEKVKWGIGVKDQYHFFCIDFDWETGTIKEMKQYFFNNWEKRVDYWYPLKENFLLVCARTNIDKREKNAYVVDKDGNVLKSMFWGDKVNECYTTPNGRIITSYGDEAIFDEDNWPAETGISMWDEDGKRIWKNKKYDIWHTYAMNLDPHKQLWFYYYGHMDGDRENMFHLVCSRKVGDYVFKPDIKNCRKFAVSEDYKKLWLGGGYRDENSVYSYDMDCKTQKLSNKQKVIFELDGKPVKYDLCDLSEDKVFLLMRDGTLLAGQLC